MNPGSRPRWGIGAVIGGVVVVGALATVLAVDSEDAGASELVAFASCEELSRWTAAPQAVDADEGLMSAGATTAAAAGEDAAASQEAAPAPMAARDSAGNGEASSVGDTNVSVEGVDELDVVDRIDATRTLVAAAGKLSLVDLAGGAVLASLPAPYDARVSYDPEAGVAWLVGSPDSGGGIVRRVKVGAAELTDQGEWTTSGWIMDARRVDGDLHVVAVESFGAVDLPFANGPVPCDQVLRPAGPSGSEATLLATLPVDGELTPRHSTEVVGSGQFVHVTAIAAYLATPLYEGDGPQTSIHRFDLATLEHTGSGRVDGLLLNTFSMSEQGGHLRVAVTEGFGMARGLAIADVDPASPEPAAVSPQGEDGADATAEPSNTVAPPDAPAAGAATTVMADGPDAAVSSPAGDDRVGLVAPAAPPPDVADDEPRNEIVVLDTDGDLDVVGRTARFGHPGEALQGIRFVGDTAYAVTFLQTDPFYVVDLADPTAPAVVGEVELPGFSAYLHPMGPGLVAGFGPDGDGKVAVKLFDVSDPAAPTVVDDEVLGDESAVVWDYHAYLGLGEGRFAVPAATWVPVEPAGCTTAGREEKLRRAEELERQLNVLYTGRAIDEAKVNPLQRELESIYTDPCVFPQMVTDTAVVVASVAGSSVEVEQRIAVRTSEPGSRLMAVGDDWAVLAGAQLVIVDPAGNVVADVALA